MADEERAVRPLPPRPVDLPALRDETAEAVAASGGAPFRRMDPEAVRCVQGLTGYVIPVVGHSRWGEVAAKETRRLAAADLFFVSPEMSTLAHSAAATMPDVSVLPEDVPSRNGGLIYFAAPLNLGDESEDGRPHAPVVVAVWSEVFPHHPTARKDVIGDGWTRGGVWISWYLGRDDMIAQAMDSGGERPPQVFRDLFDKAPPLICISMTMLPYGAPAPVDRQEGWLRMLKTAWVLMSQPVASVSDVQFNRAARRRRQQQGKEPPRVRVITLRRPSSSGMGRADHEHRHQWIVRGHWRQHWYPGRKVHRPLWIAPHVKGPEGAPMLGGEKVHAWVR